MKQISRISPCVFTNQYDKYNNPLFNYNEEIIVGADAARYRNGEGSYSCVMGQGTNSTTSYQTVVGRYNATNENALFLIGNGTSSAKSNIVEVYTNKFTINKNLEVRGTSYFADNIEVFGNGTFTNVYATTATIDKLNVEGTATIQDLIINNHITRFDGTKYITTTYAYSKNEVDGLISKLNEKIDDIEEYINHRFEVLESQELAELKEMLSNLSVKVEGIEANHNKSENIINDKLETLRNRVCYLGIYPTKVYGMLYFDRNIVTP